LQEVRTVLVIRANAPDASTTASEAQLSEDIFGHNPNDLVNLKSQFLACSDGKQKFEPYTDGNVVGNDGVLTVNIEKTANGADSEVIVTAMLIEMRKSLPDINDNHLMLCLPPGTIFKGTKDWNGSAGSAFRNYLTIFNDQWCSSPSLQLHEIGKSSYQ
jgi:hypothetical protein